MLLKNGFIIQNNNLIKKDLRINANLIAEIGDNLEPSDQEELINCENNLVMPGAIDVHVHLREPGYSYKETIRTGTLSAAKGGFTTIMAMPNLKPVPDNLNNLKVELEKIAANALVNVYPYGSVTVNEEDKKLASLSVLAKYVKAITDDGKGVNNLSLLEEAMKIAKKYDIVIASHAEDTVYKYAPEGEYIAVRREIELAKKIGCKYHFCHLSTKESFEAVRKAHGEGFTNITCEVSPHHLVLNETMIKDGNWKMNPPLRSEENRKATVEALLDNTAIMVASDHAPHAEFEKTGEYSKCLNGIIGLETMIPLIYTNFVKTNLINWDRFLDILVYNPIKVFNLPSRALKEGFVADIAVIDINTLHEYRKDEILSLGKNSPFIGQKLYGFTKFCLVNGKVIYKEEDFE